MFDPETMGELMTELCQRAVGDRVAEQRVARLADELKRQPGLEDDARFRSRVAAVRPGASPEPNGAQSGLVRASGVIETPKTGGRGSVRVSSGRTPRNAVSATTAS